MPPADDAPVPVPASARSPRLARCLLLSACAAGLVGLAVPGGSAAAPRQIAIDHAASTSKVLDDLRPARVPVELGATLHLAPLRASRQRALPATRPAVRPKPAAKPRRLAAQWFRPSYSGVVSNFGPRWGRQHKGIDFGDGHGAPIRAIGSGVVVGAGYLNGESGYGQITLIRHAGGIVSAYAHQSRMYVQTGDRVQAGEVIGLVGSTGQSTGAHLHFEIRTSTHGGQVNPLTWLRRHGVRI
ncbi:MAG: putative M23-family secreted peptidase [Frankiales bacterium]|nr:putative M23-family secreted peptidase [Frankiales bacterium]